MTWRSSPNSTELRPLVGDLRQLASVRRIVLDDGPESGVRALAFSTGGGLDFWVLSDRSFDIGPLSWRGAPIAWQGPNGFSAPALNDVGSDGGFGFERHFSGFLVTCGLDHVRQPTNGHPLHGRLPFTPGRLLSYGEDWSASRPVLFCEGEVTQARLNGERLRLKRRIEAPIGGNSLHVTDEVQNIGGREEQIALLYHMNFGFPLVGPGTSVGWRDGETFMPVFKEDNPSVTCVPTGGREDNTCVIKRQDEGHEQSLVAEITFDAATLPWLQVWRDPRPHHHIIAIEPVTSARRADGTSEPGPILEPGDTARFSVEIKFAG